MWIILIGFPNTNDFANVGICKCEFKFTCHGYCRFNLKLMYDDSEKTVMDPGHREVFSLH